MLDVNSASLILRQLHGGEIDTGFPGGVEVPGYRLLEQIGRGAGGRVFRAAHERTGLEVAIKLMHDRLFDDEAVGRAWRELAALERLHVRGVPRVLDFGEADGRLYIASELVRGDTISRFVEASDPPSGEVVGLLIRVCEVVQRVHERGVVHRDLKPSNILIDADGEVHVIDFGLALVDGSGAGDRTIAGTPLGTPLSMAPEQARGERDLIGTRSDVYALGAIARLLLVGKPPHEPGGSWADWCARIASEPAPHPRSQCRGLDRNLAAVLAKATAFDPADRYEGAAALARDLTRCLRHERVDARDPGLSERLWATARRHPWAAASLGLTAAAALALNAQHLYWHHRSEQQMSDVEQLTDAWLRHGLQDAQYRIGSSEMRRDVLEVLGPSSEWLNRQRPGDARAAMQRAQVLLHRAELLESSGDFEAGHAACVQAVAALEGAIGTRAEEGLDVVRQRAFVLVRTGDLAAKAGRQDDAEPWYRRAHDELERAAAAFPTAVGVLDDLYWSWDRLRLWVPAEHLLAWLQAQVDRSLALVALDDSRALSYYALATSHLRIGRLLMGTAPLAAAEPLRQARQIGGRLARLEPDRVAFRELEVVSADFLLELACEGGAQGEILNAAADLATTVEDLHAGVVTQRSLRGVVRRSHVRLAAAYRELDPERSSFHAGCVEAWRDAR